MAEPLQALLGEAARRLRAARATSALQVHHNGVGGCHRLKAAATIPGDAAEGFAQALARAAGGG